MGRKVCLLDLDLRAPSLYSVFKNGSNYWVNDYLSKCCEIEKVLVECTPKGVTKGKLLVGLANPSIEAIRCMEARSRAWEMEALGRLFSLKTALLNDMQFDCVVLDTSPGLNYSSINAIVSADFVLVVTSTDKSDAEGTQRMLRELYELFDKKTGIIINSVFAEHLALKQSESESVRLESHKLPVIGVIPCFCDVRIAGSSCLFVAEKPDHPFTKILQEIAVTLSAKISKAAEAKSKPLLLPQSARVFSPFSNKYTLPMNER
jgi:septum site-determining protein MinD